MIKNRKRRLLCLAVLLAATLITLFSVSGIPALAANEPPIFKNVLLSIYPEYDDPLALGYPTVLVMLEGQIEGTPPADVRFLVPSGAAMYSAGSGPRTSYARGEALQLGQPSDIPGWEEVSYTLNTDTFVVEYYVAIPTSPNRDFSVDFMPLFDINGLRVIVQEPRQATDFSVVTQNQTVQQPPVTDTEGFKIQPYFFNSLKSGQKISFNISYTKNTQSPSLAISQGPSTVGLLVIFGTVMGILLLVVLYRVRRNSSSRRRIRSSAPANPRTRKAAGGRFCTQCGAKLDKSERFCTQCGAKQSGQ